MTTISHCMWFDSEAEEAAKFYTSIFKESKMGKVTYYRGFGTEVHGQPKGKVMTAEFELNGIKYLALNGGPLFKFSEAFSICVICDTQEEIDYYWDALTAGGKEVQCGWLKDKYGVSWQVTPKILGQLMNDPDPAKGKRVTDAFMKMKKYDIAALHRAYEG